MPNIDKECVTHHYCACTAEKIKHLESLVSVGRECAEALECAKNIRSIPDFSEASVIRDEKINTALTQAKEKGLIK